ncbi:hypothetical protein ASPBRDRAFT_609472 [Aspergillus brasiliensis CBS 101740]|uniref:Uncharacterized protein n=1 Tax=Aspergillus brasiliensis (strain CBS 101740 / IMI 381727 / IBT 21946) TaxID=767769 RepID=A0A1L9UI08_ASPBC|nr:hypothetical protein ASPBRDRAFT_609472 [Aspergillus brasiliensis CBS 101740]
MAFFLICPRFRKYWKGSDSDARRSYKLNPAKPSPGSDSDGHSKERDDVARSGHHRRSSGGLPDRLRRRFSREARDQHVKSRNSRRKSGSPALPFYSRFASPGERVATPDEIGSSFMSERGYDSDAQFISTPKQISHTRDHPSNPRVLGNAAVTPLRREMEQGMPYVQAHGPEFEDLESAPCVDPTLREESQPALRSKSQLSCMTQSSQGSSSFRGTDDGSPRFRVARPQRGMAGSPLQGKIRNGPAYPKQQGYRPPLRMASPDPSIHGSGFSNPISPVPYSYTTSADSLVGPSSQISVRKRRQQPPVGPTPDNCSVHLDDLKIPTTLASRPTSPRILSPKQSFDENRWINNGGTWNPSQPFHDFSGFGAGKTPDAYATGPRSRGLPVNQASSCYSQKTSLSSTGDPGGSMDRRIQYQALTKQPQEPIASFSCSPRLLESSLVNARYASIADNQKADLADSQKSRFGEGFESVRSFSSPGHGNLNGADADLASPRKVSVGWMSGGRRLGYGYALVPANDGAEESSESLNPIGASVPEVTAVGVGLESGRSRPLGNETDGPNKKTSPRAGNSSFELSSVVSRMRLRSFSSAFSEGLGEQLKSSVLEKFSRRKKEQVDPVADDDTKNPWDFCSWVDPNQPSNDQQSGQKSSSVSTKSTEGRPLGRWATLRRTGSLLAKGRSVSAITHGFEAKPTTRMTSSAGKYPVALRKEARILKFKVLDRKNRAKSADDDVPIISNEHLHETTGSDDIQHEGQGHDQQTVQTDTHRTKKDRHNSSDKTGSETITDDWKSTYQDCQEMLG